MPIPRYAARMAFEAASGTASTAAVAHAIRAFIEDTFPLGGDLTSLGGGDSLLDAGILDSTAVLELVDFVESRFGIRVSDDDLLPENFDSIDGLVRYVETRRAEAEPGRA